MGKGESVGLGVRSEEITGVSHDALWRSIMASIREPGGFYPCSGVYIVERQGLVEHTLAGNGDTYREDSYDDEQTSETVYLKLVNSSETDVESVVAVRTKRLQIQFHMRSKVDGLRRQWDMRKSAGLAAVDAYDREARHMEGCTPTTVGHGITPNPIRNVTFDHLFAATDLAIKEAWRTIEVAQSSCQVQDGAGVLTRE